MRFIVAISSADNVRLRSKYNARMKKHRRPLTDQEKEWAKNLNRLWLARKPRPRGKRLTQEMAAELAGWKYQSTVSQYLNGDIPLNTDAILKFSELIPCDPGDINPSFALMVRREKRAQVAQELADLADEIGEENHAGLLALVRAYVQQIKTPKPK